MKSIYELKSEALLSLNEKWGISDGCTLIFFIIGIALGLIPYIGNIASTLVSGALSVGLCNFFLLVSKSKNTSIEDKKMQGKVLSTFVKGEELYKTN